MSPSRFTRNPLIAGMEEVRGAWGWIRALAILLVVFGVVCIVADVTAIFATELAFGWLLLITGVVTLVRAFHTRTWSGFFLSLFGARLRGIRGISADSISVCRTAQLHASFFYCGRAVPRSRCGNGEVPALGLVRLLRDRVVALGIMLLAQMPASSIWFIGFALRVHLIVDGASLVGFATPIHSLPAVPVYRAAYVWQHQQNTRSQAS